MSETAEWGAVERRAHPRRRVLKNALIVFNHGQCTIKCQVLELSEGGARLVPADPLLCPNEFVLKPDIGESRECEIVWRKGTKVGVSYIAKSTNVVSHPTTMRQPDQGRLISDKADEFAVLEQAIEQAISTRHGLPNSAAFLLVSIVNPTSSLSQDAEDLIGSAVIELARKLRGCLRTSDVIGALGHHQLGIVLPYFKNGGAMIVMDKIRMLNPISVATPSAPVEFTIRVDCIFLPVEGLTPADVIRRAQGQTALVRYTSLRTR